MKDIAGHIKPILGATQWLDLVFKSDLSAEHKLIAAVIARTCLYNRTVKMQLSSISLYNISRILKMNQQEVSVLVDKLIVNGWLFDTERAAGATKVYALTFSLLPLNNLRE
ncbi:hypothetical protein FDI69_gp055 [Rhodococcus phage Trina]|uniref:Uncharacterized protein n=1 Tax=Rhodococcus phage Trina TaxID=2027905 RepID=A0A2D0ZMX6_9CAUD|nr:hypothetical protein FDI69_gp055 [Rhodococcus phage Trina]ASZ74871.1 hypothetical protein SEA_TRINA_55 [Rhodococcus phage Trina]